MEIHAIIHTTGVCLNDRYYPLELAYLDSTGESLHFLINSPYSYHEFCRNFPRAYKPDAIMTKCHGTSIQQVRKTLRNQFEKLGQLIGKHKVCFGYKGPQTQARVLIDAGIPNIAELDSFGVPSLKSLYASNKGDLVNCPWHIHPNAKCAKVAVQLLSNFRSN